MDGRESTDRNVWKCTVNKGRLIPYWDDKIPIFDKPFFSILEIFQIEVFSFLISTSNVEKGTFEEFKENFQEHFDFLKLDEERISRALDIALDSGLIRATWKEKDGMFLREFANDSEASGIFKDILEIYEQEMQKR